MNANAKPYDPSIVKDVLCKYFNMPANKSSLKIRERNFLGLGGPRIHYYHFTLTAGKLKRCAFGKTVVTHNREYRALQYLTNAVPEQQRNTSRPITSLKHGSDSLLLLEYLEGYSSPLSILHSLYVFPKRALHVERMGTAILNKIYDLQKHFPIIYTPLSKRDTDETPGQPEPISVFKQLDSIRSLSSGTKVALRTRLSAIASNQTLVRRGVIHGQMGMRNIMMNRSNILFIDWEYMQPAGLCLFDPCYMATMLLMRGVQLFIPRSQLDTLSSGLFEHIRNLEDKLTERRNRRFIADGLWFAKCLSMVDTLCSYERDHSGPLAGTIRQTRRKIKYLACHIERDVTAGRSPNEGV